MTKPMPTTFFTVCVSMSDWADCPNDDDVFYPRADFNSVLEILDIDVNICKLQDYYFDDIAVGTGDIFVFKSPKYSICCFIVDLYREITDQIDCVSFYISAPDQQAAVQIKPFLRRFYEQANYQLAYEENCASAMVKEITKRKSGDIYRVIKENGYEQKIIIK